MWGEFRQGIQIQIADQREIAIAQQAGPQIIGAHLQAPLVLTHRRGRIFGQVDVVVEVIVNLIGLARTITPVSAIAVHSLPVLGSWHALSRNMVKLALSAQAECLQFVK